jgi:hypothetical protein
MIPAHKDPHPLKCFTILVSTRYLMFNDITETDPLQEP